MPTGYSIIITSSTFLIAGTFSFYSQPKSHGAGTILEFIEKAMEHSRNGKFLYFLRPKAPGLPPAPVQLLYPVSRFRILQSLQHACRFVMDLYLNLLKKFLQEIHFHWIVWSFLFLIVVNSKKFVWHWYDIRAIPSLFYCRNALKWFWMLVFFCDSQAIYVDTKLIIVFLFRFVILKQVRYDHIDQLPLPLKMKAYLKESQYYAEYIIGNTLL